MKFVLTSERSDWFYFLLEGIRRRKNLENGKKWKSMSGVIRDEYISMLSKNILVVLNCALLVILRTIIEKTFLYLNFLSGELNELLIIFNIFM